MSPNIPAARKKLGYPLYAADFDPLNHDFLLIGGGGGSSSTGVPNKISLVDVSRRSELNEVVDIELAKDEDSVSSLRVAQADDQSLIAYAGINSSEADQRTGKNEHLRSFSVALPAKMKSDSSTQKPGSNIKTQPLAKASFFRPAPGPKYETYQRILRLSPPRLENEANSQSDEKVSEPLRKLRKRVAAVASGLGSPNEILTFSVTSNPTPRDVLSRISLEKSEASDLDLIDVDSPKQPFTLIYCTDNAVFLQPLGSSAGGNTTEPVSVYKTDASKEGKLRGIRFLTQRYFLLLRNRPNRAGVELIIMKTDKDFTQAQQVLRKRLGNMKVAVGLDTCTLSTETDGSQQYVVAVAGQDSSIQVLVVDWLPGSGMGKFKQYASLTEVHQGPITRVCFSTFFSPTLPITSTTPPQYIRLASVGVDQHVVVQTLPLLPSPASGTGNERPRYVLVQPSDILSNIYNTIMAFLTLILVGTMMLSFMEIRGAIPPTIGATKYLPLSWQEKYARPYAYSHGSPGPVIPESMPEVQSVKDNINLASARSAIEEIESSIPSLDDTKDTLASLVQLKKSDPNEDNKAIVIRDIEAIGGELVAELKNEAQLVKEETLRKWEHLTEKEKKTWKQKLVDAGHWTEKQGESVLKGILFSELAGLAAAL